MPHLFLGESSTAFGDIIQHYRENRYAITFLCGISCQYLYGLSDDLVCFLTPESIHAWCRPQLLY
ncbi:MAG: hypothetical protein IK013_02920 [Bacteroidales bacterium]|nr:hypothetical protein [Bacteroidales bacterium]